ncbi:glycine cleavage system protein H [Vagococcus xieshaowenii]|uniref:Glycine cleavage system protein H n=1 Tax=Vagococcus xieshaowenii TaxID=2562451 RepID=A0AAJ5EHJ3_9ENTE|nr:glycine cleavage system protein H [Vagococcus xieshaowenii]QCA28845.1 glycine cleavage system protein H [Vagococcus xieshaowenii]TFZ43448.1 glycine cleavage system protein H [Vagococcus xieshaowenii]
MEKKIADKYLWITKEEQGYRLGFTNEGQEELGNITFVSLPKVGRELVQGEPFADVEAEKAVTELVSPVSGRVIEINEAALDTPSILDSEMEATAWLLVVADVDDTIFASL